MSDPHLSLADAMRQTRQSYPQLWLRYFALGGDGTLADLHRHVVSQDCPSDHEHNIIAQALNDVFLEHGHDHPVAYRHLYQHQPRPMDEPAS